MKYGYLIGLLFSIVVFGAGTAWADTTWVAAGEIQGQWDTDHSPYMIQGEIHVPANAELVIEPGVEVYFDGPYPLVLDSAALITALGTVADSIRFHTDPLANPGGWRGLSLYRNADTCRFAYCVFERAAHIGNGDGGALFARAANFVLTHSRFSFNTGDSTGWDYGGSLAMWGGTARIEDCVFEHSVAHSGGGVFITGTAHGTLLRSVIRHCAALRGGGLLTVSQMGGFVVQECLLANNEAALWGGGLWEDIGDTRYLGCTFRDNVSHRHGGGALARTLGWFENCRFEDNHADSLGGAVYANYIAATYPHAAFDRCLFYGNSALQGGGICVSDFQSSTQLRIRRSVFAQNVASLSGGGLYCLPSTQSEVELLSCAFVYTQAGAAIANPPRIPSSFHHCGFFENAGGDFTGTVNSDLGVINTTNRNGYPCDARQNLYLPPLFVDAEHGDFHLAAESPYVDAGFILGEGNRDPDGTFPEIGAYYVDQTSAAAPRSAPAAEFRLEPAYPNPFNATTRLSLTLPAAGPARLAVYDLLGREVAVLLDEHLAAGAHAVAFRGEAYSSGLYFARLTAAGHSAVQKMLLIK